MAKKIPADDAADYIENLNMNGLEGRMLYLPTTGNKKRHILLVYGHHSQLEWWYELAKQFNKYGSVTVPDLPGFGGMESLKKIKERPTLNNWADYLAAFIKLRYKRRSQITIVGAGFGFAVATRMLQRYPAIVKSVNLMVSLNGFSHGDDLKLTAGERRKLLIKNTMKLSLPISRKIFFSKNSLNNISRKAKTSNKYCLDNLIFFKPSLEEDVRFWRVNDLSSHRLALKSMLKLDNCIKKIDLPVWHITTYGIFLDHHNVEQHMRVIYKDFHLVKPRSNKKASASMTDLVPAKLRRELAKTPV